MFAHALTMMRMAMAGAIVPPPTPTPIPDPVSPGNLITSANLADPSWTGENSTVANGGTLQQALVENGTLGLHARRTQITKDSTARSYELKVEFKPVGLPAGGDLTARGKFADFLLAIRLRESSGNYQAENAQGAIGAYQMHELTLKAIGFYDDSTPASNPGDDWIGNFTPLSGLTHAPGAAKQAFKDSPATQDAAMKALLQYNWDTQAVPRGMQPYIGTLITQDTDAANNGTIVTALGILGGYHLWGPVYPDNYIKSAGLSRGTPDPSGTYVGEYIRLFSGYDCPMDPWRNWLRLAVFNAGFTASAVGNFNGAANAVGTSYGVMGSGLPTITNLGDGFYEATLPWTHDTSTTINIALFMATEDDGPLYSGYASRSLQIRSVKVTEVSLTGPTPPPAPAVNLLTAPTNFGNAAWGKSNLTIANANTVDQAVMEVGGSSLFHSLFQSVARSAALATYRLQFDAKATLGRDWVSVTVQNATDSDAVVAFFNITTGAIGTTGNWGGVLALNGTPVITDMGNGIKRVTMDWDHDAIGPSMTPIIRPASADGVEQYVGDVTKGMIITNCVLGLKP